MNKLQRNECVVAGNSLAEIMAEDAELLRVGDRVMILPFDGPEAHHLLTAEDFAGTPWERLAAAGEWGVQ